MLTLVDPPQVSTRKSDIGSYTLLSHCCEVRRWWNQGSLGESLALKANRCAGH